jgi:hypothetical protein
VSQYTTRNLSFETDILNAFSGISNILATQLGSKFLFGIPEKYLSTQLFWSNVGATELRASDPSFPGLIPTWSWAAWKGEKHHQRATVNGSGFLVQFHFQDPQEGLRPLDVEEQWFSFKRKIGEDSLLDENETVDNEYERKLISKINESIPVWKACPHNPWETERQTFLQPQACELALRYPGCLLFNTTTASLFLRKHVYDTNEVATYSYLQRWESNGRDNSQVCLEICNETGGKRVGA